MYITFQSSKIKCPFYQMFTGMTTHTDLEGIFPVNVIIHRQHGYMKAWKKDASKYPFLFFIFREKKNKCEKPPQCIDLMS